MNEEQLIPDDYTGQQDDPVVNDGGHEKKFQNLTQKEIAIIESSDLSPAQCLAVKGYVDNCRSPQKKTKGQVLTEAGYGKTVCERPKEVFGRPRVRSVLDSIVSNLDKAARSVTDVLAEHDYSSEGAKENAYVMDKLIKNRQLLSGESTENTDFRISWAE